jgi:MFS family permease
MQGLGLVAGPLVAMGLLSTGISQDYAWRIMLALGAAPALAVFWLRRRIKETPRFLLADMEAREAEQRAASQGRATGLRGMLAEPRLLRWLIGASLAWLLFDFVYYGNTISSPVIVKLVDPKASLLGHPAGRWPSSPWPRCPATCWPPRPSTGSAGGCCRPLASRR